MTALKFFLRRSRKILVLLMLRDFGWYPSSQILAYKGFIGKILKNKELLAPWFSGRSGKVHVFFRLRFVRCFGGPQNIDSRYFKSDLAWIEGFALRAAGWFAEFIWLARMGAVCVSA